MVRTTTKPVVTEEVQAEKSVKVNGSTITIETPIREVRSGIHENCEVLFGVGRLSVSIWTNEKGKTVQLSKSIFSKESNQYENYRVNLFPNELATMISLLEKAGEEL